MSEDTRVASGTVTTLSGQLMAGAFAIIGAQAAIMAIVIDNRAPTSWFFASIASGLLAVAFAAISAYAGGSGIGEIAAAGFGGDWKLTTTHGRFRRQTQFMLLAAGFLFLSVILASAAPPKDEPSQGMLQQRLRALEERQTKIEERMHNAEEAVRKKPRCVLHPVSGTAKLTGLSVRSVIVRTPDRVKLD